jgi:hypothetical protein
VLTLCLASSVTRLIDAWVDFGSGIACQIRRNSKKRRTVNMRYEPQNEDRAQFYAAIVYALSPRMRLAS